MSIETMTPLSNDVRYDLKMKYFKISSYVVYEMVITDLAMGKKYDVSFRFSEIRKFHEKLERKYEINKSYLPELPKTNSICFWNRTNESCRKI